MGAGIPLAAVLVISGAVALGSTATPGSTAPAAQGGPAVTIDRAEVAQTVRSAVDQLRETGRIDIRYHVTGAEGGDTEGWGRVDISTGAYDLAERTTADGIDFTHERRQIGEVLFLRDVIAGTDPATIPWASVPHGAEAPREMAGALTARGRVLPSLDRLVLLVEQLPFAASRLADTPGRLLLSIPAETVRDYYRETGLQQVQDWDEALAHAAGASGASATEHGPPVPDVAFELLIDERGALVELRAFGSVFHDGELLTGASIEIQYSAAGDAAPITAPAGPDA